MHEDFFCPLGELKFSFFGVFESCVGIYGFVSPKCVGTNKNEQLSLSASIPGQRCSTYDESAQLLSPNEFKCTAFTENFKQQQL